MKGRGNGAGSCVGRGCGSQGAGLGRGVGNGSKSLGGEGCGGKVGSHGGINMPPTTSFRSSLLMTSGLWGAFVIVRLFLLVIVGKPPPFPYSDDERRTRVGRGASCALTHGNERASRLRKKTGASQPVYRIDRPSRVYSSGRIASLAGRRLPPFVFWSVYGNGRWRLDLPATSHMI
jgi:hypothetical protein